VSVGPGVSVEGVPLVAAVGVGVSVEVAAVTAAVSVGAAMGVKVGVDVLDGSIPPPLSFKRTMVV
jgi:hypothetical protein